MPSATRYQNWRLEKDGDLRCNLCLAVKPLTDDHIPPKCVGNNKLVKIRRFYHDRRTNTYPYSIRKVPGGITYKTLCGDCNSLIGTWDPELKVLADAVKSARRRGDWFVPDQVRLGAVIRAFLGHVVAAKLVIDNSSPDNAIREYLIGDKPLDPLMRVYLWYHDIDDIAVVRDFVVSNVAAGENSGILSIIKFRPLAICASYDGLPMKYPELTSHASLPPRTTVSANISFMDKVNALWPEHAPHVDRHQVLTLGDAFVRSGVETRETVVASLAAGPPL